MIMRWNRLVVSLLMLVTTTTWAEVQSSTVADSRALPKTTTGRIERLADFPSRHVATRHIDVWLPNDFNPANRYQVLYMQDGQNLFDGSMNWTKKSWRADEAVDRLAKSGRIADTIIVGIWNNGTERYA
jgi:predicted alpha/beta superfamily hydrolase